MKHQAIEIIATDGHRLDCFVARAAGKPRGAVIVLQEIFGVNHHIRSICERLAAMGYDAFAPALFDRMQRQFESGYAKDDVAQALAFLPKLDWDAMVMDTLATVAVAASGVAGNVAGGSDHERAQDGIKVAALGFCLGASVAYLAAQQTSAIDAVIGYYGGHIAQHLDRPAPVPTLLHYGETDHTIPMSAVDLIRRSRPECEVHVYPAGHGFNCDERASFEPASAAIAWGRSVQFLQSHIG